MVYQTLPVPTVPELHRWGNGRWCIRYPEPSKKTGKPRARNYKLNTSDEDEAGRQLITFTKDWKSMQSNPNGFKHDETTRERWRKAAAEKRLAQGIKPRKAKSRKIPRVASGATEPGHAVPDTHGGVVASRALVPTRVVSDDPKATYSREHYAQRKQEAERGKASTDAIRRINEHVGVLAANLEVAGRTLKMITRMISELELEP